MLRGRRQARCDVIPHVVRWRNRICGGVKLCECALPMVDGFGESGIAREASFCISGLGGVQHAKREFRRKRVVIRVTHARHLRKD